MVLAMSARTLLFEIVSFLLVGIAVLLLLPVGLCLMGYEHLAMKRRNRKVFERGVL